jgi:hypothetical protein
MSRTKWVMLTCVVLVAALVLLVPLIFFARAAIGTTKSMIATTRAKIAANETTVGIAGPAGTQIALAPNYTDGWLIETLPAGLAFFPDYHLVQISEDVSVSSFYASDSKPVVCGVLATYGTGPVIEPYFIIILSDTESLNPLRDYSTTFKTRGELEEAWAQATGTALPEGEPHNIER